MSPDPDADLSDRARRAQQLTDAVLASQESCDRIDDLIRSAATALDGDVASLSMLSDRQITVGACLPGASAAPSPDVVRGSETSFEDTICANALRSDGSLIIPDTRCDSRVSSLPVVSSGLVGAYLGSPLRLEGAIIGVLCVVATEARAWTAEQLIILDQLAAELLVEILRCSAVSAA